MGPSVWFFITSVKDGGALTTCPKCGATLRPHRACTKCGYYNGKEVIAVAQNEEE